MSISLTQRISSALIGYTLAYLNIEELCAASNTCKIFQRVASQDFLWKAMDLTRVIPGYTRLDERVWLMNVDCPSLELDPSGSPALIQDKNTVKYFYILSSWVEGNAGITDLTLPKGLSLKKIIQLESSHKNKITVLDAYQDYSHQIENRLEKTERVFITNFILKGSRNLDFDAQQELVQRVSCEIPDPLSLSTLSILTNITSSKSSPPLLYFIKERDRYWPVDKESDGAWTHCQKSSDWEKSYCGIFGFPQACGEYRLGKRFKTHSNFLIGAAAQQKLKSE